MNLPQFEKGRQNRTLNKSTTSQTVSKDTFSKADNKGVCVVEYPWIRYLGLRKNTYRLSHLHLQLKKGRQRRHHGFFFSVLYMHLCNLRLLFSFCTFDNGTNDANDLINLLLLKKHNLNVTLSCHKK